MDEDKSVLLFEVLFDAKDAEKKAEQFEVSLARLRAEQAATKKELKAGVISYDEYGKSMKAIKTQIADVTKEQKANSKAIEENAKSQKAADGIVRSLTTQIQAATAQSAEFVKSLGRSANETLQVNARIRALNNELTVQHALANASSSSMEALGQTTAELTVQYNQLSKAQREDAAVGGVLLTQINDLNRVQEKNQKVINASQKGLKDYIRDIDVLGFNVGNTVDSFESGAKGVGTFAKAALTGRSALILLGAVPILLFFTALVTFLTQSQRGMDLLQRATSAVFTVFGNKVAAVGGAIVNALENPKQALKDLAEFVGNNLINRFTALRVIVEGITSLSWRKTVDGIFQLATGIKDVTSKTGGLTGELSAAAKEGYRIAAANQAIRDSEIVIGVERAKGRAESEKLKKLADDQTKSTAVREAAAKQAYAIENRFAQQVLKLQKDKIALIQQEIKLNTGKGDKVKVADAERLAAAQKEYYESIEENAERTTEIQNTLNGIQQQGAQKAEEMAKRAAANAVAEAENALIMAKQKGESTIEIEEEVLRRQIELIKARAAAEKVGAEVTAAQKKLIDSKAQAEELDALEEHARKVEERTLSIQESTINARLALVSRNTEKERKIQEDSLNNQRDKEKSAAVDTIKNKEELFERKKAIDAKYDAAIENLNEQFEKDELIRTQESEQQKLQIQQDLNEVRKGDLLGLAADRIKLEEDTQIKLLEVEKKYSLMRVTGDTEEDRQKERLKIEAAFAQKKLGIQANTDAKSRELNRQQNELDISDRNAMAATKLALSKQGSRAELDAHIEQINLQREASLNVAHLTADEIIAINAKANREIEDAQTEFFKRRANQIITVLSTATSAIADAVNAGIENQTKALDDQQQAVLSSATLSAEAREKLEKQYAKRKEALEKEAAQKRKKIALVEAVINTASAVVEALPNPILVGLAAAVGALQIAVISSQQFARGGYVSDKKGAYIKGPGTGTSDSIPARISNGESVINAKSTKQFYQQLSDINEAGGGRRFPGIKPGKSYPVQYRQAMNLAMGGVVAYAKAERRSELAGAIEIDYDKLSTMMADKVVLAAAAIPAPVVGVKAFTDAADKVVKVENGGSIR